MSYRIKYYFLFAFLLLISFSSFSQKNKEKNADGVQVVDDANVDPTSLAVARFQINDIKTRGIIVRLKTNQDRITAFRKSGDNKVADKMESRARGINLLLVNAFITEWTYCPIYFMESQYTSKLILKDTLIAKTYDLKRDTAIYCSRDSFYIVDYGDLMSNEADGNHPLKVTHESNNPVPGTFLVVKDNNQEQLQRPMPYEAKVWLSDLNSAEKIEPVAIPQSMTDSLLSYLSKYPSYSAIIKSDGKNLEQEYMKRVYDHIINPEFTSASALSSSSIAQSASSGKDAKVTGGDPFQKSAQRLNKAFINYYCKRLDKDRNILSSAEPYYWWLRNPNIQYMPYLHQLEIWLKENSDKEKKNTK